MFRLRLGLLPLIALVAVAVLLSGCETEPGFLEELPGKRLGISLQMDGSPVDGYRSALVQYVGRRVKVMQVVGVDYMPAEGEDESAALARFKNDMGLDYLLIARVVDGPSIDEKSRVSLESDSFSVRVTYECTLSLRYKLVDLKTGEVLIVGESRGSESESLRLGAGKAGLNVSLSPVDRDQLIEDALIDAARRSELL